ncbi:MAG: uracil-DNA glycosylase [Planctomycetota bacterium]|jgi:DNA polymerase
MNERKQALREALAQQLECDRMLGVRSLPVVMPPLPAPRAPGASEPAAAPRPETPAATGGKQVLLDEINRNFVSGCTKCRLAETRLRTVFGQGNPDARIAFVGEAPGFEEDRQGLAFVGKAGQLLTRIIEGGMGIPRDDVYICNVIKCRPPNNRDPQADEILACSPYLRQQLSIVQPEVVVALGSPASKTLLNTAQSIGKLRGRFHDYYLSGTTGVGPSIPLMPTYHPAYLLRNPAEKTKTWEDIKMVMGRLGLPKS